MFLHAGSKAQNKNTEADSEWSDRRVRHVGSRSAADDFLENPHYPVSTKRSRKLFIILLCIITLSAATVLSAVSATRNRVTRQDDASQMADLYASELGNSISNLEWMGSFFGNVMQQVSASDNSDDLNDLVESLISPGTALSSMGIYSEGKIRYVYSVDQMNRADFKDLMDDVDAEALMEKAARKNSAVLSDIVSWNGSQYFTMCVPVIDLKDPKAYYGYALLLISYPDFMKTGSLDLIRISGYDITVAAGTVNQQTVVYATTTNASLSDPMEKAFRLCDINCSISIAPRGGWLTGTAVFFSLVLPYLISIIIIFLGLFFLRIRSERETAEYYAMYDSLTRVKNRQALRKNFGRLAAQPGKLFVMLIDLDNFKSVNDIHGHASGDTCLTNVGQALRRVFPPEGCFRYGGDEFLLITPEKSKEDFDRKVADMMDVYQSLANDAGLSTTLSAGYVYGSCRDMNDLRKMMYQADVNLYEIKKSFKGNVRGRAFDPDAEYRDFEQESDRERKTRKYIADTFRTALKNKWISVVYQPIIRSLTGRLAYVEALARWNDPEKGFITPDTFIPVLEQSSFISDLDLYVIEVVCRDFRREAENHYPAISTSINLAYNDLRDPSFIGKIIEIADRYQVPHHNLCFEVKEVPESSGDILRQRMHELRNNGFRVWLDDFGSNYSSLKGLQLAQVDLVKLDIRFLDNLPGYADDRQHIEAIISMLKQIGVQVLSERVENDYEKEILVSSGCGLLQGYCCARPISEDMLITEWLSRPKRVENPESHRYYSDINLTDILQPKFNTQDDPEFPNDEAIAMAIMEVRDDNTYRLISENDSFRAFHIHTHERVSRMITNTEDIWKKDFNERLLRIQTICCAHPDTWHNMDYITSAGDYCIARLRYLSSDPSAGVTALSFVVIDLRMFSQSGSRLADLPPDAAGKLGVIG